MIACSSRLEVKAQWQRHWLEEVVGDSRTSNAQPPIELLLQTTTADVLWHHQHGEWLTGTIGVSGMYQTNNTSGVDPLIPDATTTTGGAFAFEQATKGQWSLLAGIRGDYGKINADSNTDLALSAQTRNGSAFSGDIGAVYRPVPQLALSLNVGKAFSYPTMPELFSNGPLPAEGIYTVGLPTAVPQSSLDFDASVRWVTPQLSAAVSFYRNQINDYLFLDPTGNTATVPNDAGGLDTLDVWQYTQTSHATLSGVDISAEWAATRMFTLRGRYDMVSGTNDANGEPLPLMPPPRGDLSVEWHTITGRPAYVSFGTHIVGRQTRPNPTAPTDSVTAAYNLFELGGGISQPFGSHTLQLDIRVTNLFGTTYSDFLSRYKTFAYGPGRNFIFRLSVPM